VRIIPRAEWGARHDNGAGTAPTPAGEVWLHHTVTGAVNGTAIIREVEVIGEARFGTGISYTWLVTPDGSVYEGHSPGRMGTHTGGRNSIARAICWVGNYDIVQPTTAQVEATAWLLQEAHRRGWVRVPRLNGGHRDLKATACPGKNAYALIGRINSLAAGQPVAKEIDVNLTDKIRFHDGREVAVGTAMAESWQNSYDTLALVRSFPALLAAATSNPDITEERMAEIIRTNTQATVTMTEAQMDQLAEKVAGLHDALTVGEVRDAVAGVLLHGASREGGGS
jgi:hypothetical protein